MARYAPEGLRADRSDEGAPTAKKNAGAPRPGRGIGGRAWLRWGWRQLTSMRVALMLLLLLAVVALPGAFFPQRPQDPTAVSDYLEQHPDVGPLLDGLGMFDVYGSPWFSAVYLLLFVSLIGCIVPRVLSHAQAMRAGPGQVPRRFTRFPVRAEVTSGRAPTEVADLAAATLGRAYKRRTSAVEGGAIEVSAERGYGRETGNLVFHLALVGLLVVTAWGQLVHYRGQAVVVAGDSMANAAVDYDSFTSGAWFDESTQEPFRIRLDDFTARFTQTARPDDFVADVTLMRPGAEPTQEQIRVNAPLTVGSARVYLTGNGYAPVITVTDASGEVAYSGPVLFLPQDTAYTSTGVLLVPDANGGDPQLAFNGELYPTAAYASDGTVIGSGFPLPGDPVLILNMWTGDLGLDDGVPRNLLTLDTTGLTQVTGPAADGTPIPVELELRPGESIELPEGQGTITFSSLARYTALDVRWDPSVPWMGLFAALAFAGLAASLFLPRRRIWLRILPGERGSVVHAAALARGDDPGLRRELDRVVAAIAPRATSKGQRPSAAGTAPERPRSGGSGKPHQTSRPGTSGSRTEKKSDG